jgi:RHH-type transcriptional regulator, proline utilization regulon repressor / proline dehydrogenase / delta 1-pyrroline-5-carboxylate dehydrogenase
MTSPTWARRSARRFNRGITGAQVDRQPFGGFKLSGIGAKAGGSDYLLESPFTRSVTENIMRQGVRS